MVVIIDNFLDVAINQQLLDFAVEREAEFVDTTTATNVIGYRKSKVLYEFSEFASIIDCKIRLLFFDVLAKLDLEPFEIERIEAQLTAHNHGHYYKIHNDNGGVATQQRQLTYVYYFNAVPKLFTGGELEIGARRIVPVNNTIVFFPSGCLHQVLPIECPSRSFADSRFTINGWIRQPDWSGDSIETAGFWHL
jgi:SM-20-related protein